MLDIEVEQERNSGFAEKLTNPVLGFNCSLRSINLLAALCHLLLLIYLCITAETEDIDANVTLLRPYNYWKNSTDRCGYWPLVGTAASSQLNLFTLLVFFTVVTVLAHFFYAFYDGYIEMVKEGLNPFRWLEYSLSASAMIVILAVLASIRWVSTILLIFFTTFAQMIFGYIVEFGLVNGDNTMVAIGMLTGWCLYVIVWGVIIGSFYTTIGDSEDNVDFCQGPGINFTPNRFQNRGGMPEEIKHLIWAVCGFFGSFGVNNLVQVYKGIKNDASYNFAIFEFVYIILSLSCKSLLIIWCGSSIFLGKLRWLQGCPTGEADLTQCRILFERS